MDHYTECYGNKIRPKKTKKDVLLIYVRGYMSVCMALALILKNFINYIIFNNIIAMFLTMKSITKYLISLNKIYIKNIF